MQFVDFIKPTAVRMLKIWPGLKPAARRAVELWPSMLSSSRNVYGELVQAIASGQDLGSKRVQGLAVTLEAALLNPANDKVTVHRKIGEAIFARSARLYSGDELPKYLVRYCYPPVLSIALNSHCNAACFFCRDDDYKGDAIDFDDVFKLETAIRHARTIDLTGWGEPFLYPRFEEVVSYICSINTTRQLIQVTSNGSLLSERWGKLLAGKLSRVVISLNATTEKSYSDQMRYKNKRFTLKNTLESIGLFQAQLTDEDRSRILVHMVANTDNFREIGDMVRLAANMQIPVVNIGHYICAQKEHVGKTLWNVKDQYNAALAQARELGSKLHVTVHGRQFFQGEKEVTGAVHCMAPFEQFFIEMPGSTAPCCYMGHERMGNVYEEGFETVWFSDLMNKLRQKRFLPPCQVCVVFTPFDSETAHISATLLTWKRVGIISRPVNPLTQ
jgi:MoaA/NifB/PqqE/SkfB family radical SAM enzyme